MNNDLFYTLDPYIVSILFKTKTDEDTLEVYSKLAQSLDMVLKGTIKEFLTENGFNDEDVKKVVEAEDFDSLEPKFKPYLQNIILVKRIEDNNKQFIKLYYDQLLPNLNEEEKQQLEKYLQESEEVLKLKKGEILEGVKALKEILEENGVQTYDELRAKFEEPEIIAESPTVEAEQPSAVTDITQPTGDQSMPGVTEVGQTITEPSSEQPVATQNDSMQANNDNVDSAQLSEQSQPVAQPDQVNEQPTQDNIVVPTAMPAQVGEINVGPVEQAVSAPDPLMAPTKATIVDDESSPDTASATPTENNVNAVNQLQNMGIDLNDVLQPQQPQS
jgi:DNA-binding transcriptional MerR regulator